ncbi:hypothetical protein ACHAP1_003326 [Verticillium nonalfalfae]
MLQPHDLRQLSLRLRTTRDKSSLVLPPRTASSSTPAPPPPPPPPVVLEEKADDTIHHLDHATDTLTSLSLAYNVPAQVLRAHNNLPADHLLPARRTLRIPASHYPGSPSLSPHPVEAADEIRRKAALRRFMVACKVADYDVATLYLEQAGHDLRAAVESWEADAAWERAHPQETAGLGGKGKGKGATRGGWWKIL